MLQRVISGFQNGVDIAGIRTARAAGYQVGGWMPAGYKTLDGPRPEYAAMYGAQETRESSYAVRTGLNVAMADATIRIAHKMDSRGEICTLRWLDHHKKDHFDIYVGDPAIPSAKIDQGPLDVATWLMNSKVLVLNVAGNSENTAPGIYDWATRYLSTMFRQYELLKFYREGKPV